MNETQQFCFLLAKVYREAAERMKLDEESADTKEQRHAIRIERKRIEVRARSIEQRVNDGTA